MSAAGQMGPLGVGRVLDLAAKLVRLRGWTLMAASAAFVLPVQLLAALIQASASATPTVIDQVQQLSGTPGLGAGAGDATAFVGFLLAGVVAQVGSVLGSAACVHVASEVLAGRQPQWRTSAAFAFARLPRLALLALISGAALLAASIAGGVPGFYLAVAWFVAPSVLVIEGCGAKRALGRSFSLVRGRWWSTAGVFWLGQILVMVVGSVMLVPLLVAMVPIDEGGSELGAFLIAFFASGISGVLTTPFLACAAVVTYFDLRSRKEGVDLEGQADDIGLRAPEGIAAPALAPGQFHRVDMGSGSEPPFWPPPPGWRPTPAPASDPPARAEEGPGADGRS